MQATAPQMTNMDSAGIFDAFYKLNSTDILNGSMAGTVANGSDSRALTQKEIETLIGKDMKQSWSRFEGKEETIIITFFTMLICVGSFGNGLVCFVVARNPAMRTPRNIFIINLAISDLTLCLFTQPFNLMKVLMTRWPLGEFMCKFVPMWAGTNVFVSTISITAIALDRFQVIVYPTKDSMKKVGAAVALLSIWLISVLMASPLCIFNVIKPAEVLGIFLYDACVENDKFFFAKGAYSVASMIFQYLVPILIVSVAHARICNKLKYRMVNQQSNNVSVQLPTQQRRSVLEKRRKRRTNILLIMIGVVFVSSWMPLNIFNILADYDHKLLAVMDKKGLVFPICHLLVLCSACANPILYGWLNENFRREFVKVLCCVNCRNPNRPFTVETTRTSRAPRSHINVEDEPPVSVALFAKPNATNGHTCSTAATAEETTVFINTNNNVDAC